MSTMSYTGWINTIFGRLCKNTALVGKIGYVFNCLWNSVDNDLDIIATGHAFETTQTDSSADDTQIFTGVGLYAGYEVRVAGAADGTVTIKDTTNGSDGSTLHTQTNPTVGVPWGWAPRKITNGLRVTTTGSPSPQVNVLWRTIPS